MPHLPERPSDTPPPAGFTAPALPAQPNPPAPINPVSLLVKVRDDASSSPHTHAHAGPSRTPAAAAHSNADKLRASVARQAENRRRADRWADRMMEETLDRPAFKRGVSGAYTGTTGSTHYASLFLHPACGELTSHALVLEQVRYLSPLQYSEIQHERHLNHLCSYPLCPNPPGQPYSTHRRIRISTTKRSVRQVQGNEDEGFCKEMEERGVVSFEEAKPTKWAKEAALKNAGGSDDGVANLAAASAQRQVDQRRSLPRGPSDQSDIDVPSVGTKVLSASTPTSAPQLEVDKAGLDVLVGERTQSVSGASKGIPNPTIAAKPSSVPAPSPASLIEDLVGNLTIHERPTPEIAPVPPSLPSSTSTPRAPGPAPAQDQAQDQAQDEAQVRSPVPSPSQPTPAPTPLPVPQPQPLPQPTSSSSSLSSPNPPRRPGTNPPSSQHPPSSSPPSSPRRASSARYASSTQTRNPRLPR
ncbi:hypothetical protein EHS25_000775 [Saitozyma podzolica]|uniref:RTR1-type domain-containing protein n=1 Tax=Saitozyma podzolica TaxID=1890683 RepID=A0A427YX73_9TREE|nr:hypothetical protein EHS25_000775 [Saitozyma podzolica]